LFSICSNCSLLLLCFCTARHALLACPLACLALLPCLFPVPNATCSVIRLNLGFDDLRTWWCTSLQNACSCSFSVCFTLAAPNVPLLAPLLFVCARAVGRAWLCSTLRSSLQIPCLQRRLHGISPALSAGGRTGHDPENAPSEFLCDFSRSIRHAPTGHVQAIASWQRVSALLYLTVLASLAFLTDLASACLSCRPCFFALCQRMLRPVVGFVVFVRFCVSTLFLPSANASNYTHLALFPLPSSVKQI
jgi:hypothetical protein